MRDRADALQIGRYRADFPEGAVVVLIGMRINPLWRVLD